ncbi:Peptide methionine sulfoxide reductase MsrA [Symbiodinium microadriaticum]|uniref:peptide-methionine (S)-S-oxide reductase n=1 Tax=Symbiodinium microadriaticum TaxID=2951 RepID=A0A1Q9DLL0_SYMMI|nr:Peptide methionine sulfoxide reductase MsrA [Symbiodinium microadriaticum]
MEQPGCVVAVVGAGLAGLSFAAAVMQESLRDRKLAKCKVVVFEQSLVLDPGALRSLPLARVGLKALHALECPLVSAAFRQEIDCIRREDLLKWFVSLLPADTIHFGKSFRGFHVDGNQLFCRFQSMDAGNLQLEGPFDAVVAADGLRSDVRRECEAACKQGPHRLRDLILGGSILFLGDARRAFRKERDLGLGRVFGGGNKAIEQGVQLAGSLIEAFDRAARPVRGSTSLHQALQSKSIHFCHFMAVTGLSERLRWYCRKRRRPCDEDEPSVENRSNCAGASSLLCAMDFPPEVRELVQQLKSAGMQIDESNPQEVMQALFRVQQMAANKKKAEMVSKERALPGRSEAQVVPAQHFVLNNPMRGPWPAGFKVCVFANGCFWGSEKGIWRLPGGGIYSTAVGYAGGYTPNPTYEEACSGQTGHTEAVQVVFDPSKISLVDILRWFWEAHDPTQGMGQGNDRGTQYRSALYYFDDEQRQLYEASKEAYEAELKANGKGRGPITTEIRAASDFEGEVFFYAEEYHQQYLAKPGARPYCSAEPQQVSLPAFEKWCPAVLRSKHAPKLPEATQSLRAVDTLRKGSLVLAALLQEIQAAGPSGTIWMQNTVVAPNLVVQTEDEHGEWCEAVDDCEKLLYKTAVCHFQGTTDCGGRNCGSHGVKEYQNTFDTGNSCERGYMDDGEKCDPFGIWHGSHAYLGVRDFFLLAGSRTDPAARLDDCTTEKEKERLQKQKDAAKRILPLLKVFALRGPKLPRPHWKAGFITASRIVLHKSVLVRLRTQEGLEGFGLASSYTAIDPLVKPWKNGLADLIVGEDALAPERLYHKLFRLTANKAPQLYCKNVACSARWTCTGQVASEKGWSREAMIRLSAAVDLACWDIVGKAWQLKQRGYLEDSKTREGKDERELRDDLQMMVDQGHTGFKVKIGGLPLREDMERLRVIREVIGYDKDLMVDVNRAWDFKTACEGVKLLEAFKPRWLEEPVAWEDDRRLLGLLSRRTNIPLSGGESEFTSYGCRALLEEKAISILQFDATMYGGFTEGRKLAALCELNHVQVAPHHDCFIHAQLVASTPAGLIVEAFTDPERDPLQAELYQDAPAIRNGKIKLGSAAGIGLTLNERAVEKYGERIV